MQTCQENERSRREAMTNKCFQDRVTTAMIIGQGQRSPERGRILRDNSRLVVTRTNTETRRLTVLDTAVQCEWDALWTIRDPESTSWRSRESPSAVWSWYSARSQTATSWVRFPSKCECAFVLPGYLRRLPGDYLPDWSTQSGLAPSCINSTLYSYDTQIYRLLFTLSSMIQVNTSLWNQLSDTGR